MNSKIDVLKMRALQLAEITGENKVYVSPKDYHAFVKKGEVNMDGVLHDNRIQLQIDRYCPQGTVRIESRTGDMTNKLEMRVCQ